MPWTANQDRVLIAWRHQDPDSGRFCELRITDPCGLDHHFDPAVTLTVTRTTP